MKKDAKDLVKSTINMHQEMNALTVDEINKVKDEIPEPQEISIKERAALEGAIYIEPRKRLSPPLGKLPEKLQKQHARDWEYVKGVFENRMVSSEPLKFSLCLYPGDPDYEWEVPTNRPVYVPRMVARHLSGEPDPISQASCMKYHTFDYVERPGNQWQKDDFTHRFAATGTHYRGIFRAIGEFA